MTPGCECPICNDDWYPRHSSQRAPYVPFVQRDFMDTFDIAHALKVPLSHVGYKKRTDPKFVRSIRVGRNDVYHRLDFMIWLRSWYDCIDGEMVKL